MNRESPLSPEVWERTPPEAQAYIRALEARVVMLEATVQRLEAVVQHWEALVQQLREQLQQDSRTSSRPPSSDPPQASAKRSRRGPSGQPGHAGQARALVPVDAVDVVRPVKPERCQHPLSGEDPQPERHQVTEIPPVKPVITEYQLHQLICLACGAATRGEVPVGVPTGGFGPRVQAIAALCTGAYHRSRV